MFGNDDLGFGKFTIGFIVIWILSALASLGLVGVVIWGIITLVTHFTS